MNGTQQETRSKRNLESETTFLISISKTLTQELSVQVVQIQASHLKTYSLKVPSNLRRLCMSPNENEIESSAQLLPTSTIFPNHNDCHCELGVFLDRFKVCFPIIFCSFE